MLDNQKRELNSYMNMSSQQGGAAFLCEYTPDSLIELWNWFETQIDMVAKSEEEYQAELKQFPEWMHDSISKRDFQ